jgi:hypothetical protein
MLRFVLGRPLTEEDNTIHAWKILPTDPHRSDLPAKKKPLPGLSRSRR